MRFVVWHVQAVGDGCNRRTSRLGNGVLVESRGNSAVILALLQDQYRARLTCTAARPIRQYLDNKAVREWMKKWREI